MSIDSDVLVLNKNWQAIRIEPFKKSIKKVLKGNAKFLDFENGEILDWEEWVSKHSVTEDKLNDNHKGYIKTQHFYIKVPEIVICIKYSKMPKGNVKLTKRNLFIRDGEICQYTGKKLTMKEATIDHIIPKSKGGKSSWDNLIICSLEANSKKADKTLKESGYSLKKTPVKPSSSMMFLLKGKKIKESWKSFIKV